MDFVDQIKQLAKRIESLKETIQTEEATKNEFGCSLLSDAGIRCL